MVGAAYAVACVLPKWGMLTSPTAKIALGVGMCLIAYGSERRFWRCCGCFFAVSALFGGAVWASGMLAGTGGAYTPYVPVSGRVPGLERRVSLVPYRSVGVSGGLLAAFRPDALELDGKSSSALLALGEVRGDDYEAIAPETTF